MAPRIDPVVADDSTAALFANTMFIDGKPINIFATMAHHPKLMDRFGRLGGFMLNKGMIPEREREIVILRVGWNSKSVYEFGQHTVIGKRVGLTDDEISALTNLPTTHAWSDADLALIALADDLCRDNVASDATWAALRSRWNDAELVELVVVAGFYRLVSGFLNTMGVELDPGVPGWPADAGPRLGVEG